MNKNRLFVLISSGVAILGSLLPWATVSAGIFGSMSVSGTEGDGTFIIILAVVAIVLACLKDYKTALPKNFATGIFVIGVVQSVIMLLNLINIGRMLGSQGAELKAYGVAVHIGIGFFLVVAARGKPAPPSSRASCTGGAAHPCRPSRTASRSTRPWA